MNIVLVGYRGAGKTSVGMILVERLDMTLISIDEKIEEQYDLITSIVEKFGWERFREYETEYLKTIADVDNAVIDCGGGIIERQENIDLLKSRNNIVIYLKAKAETIKDRLRSHKRPALAHDTFAEVDEILARREPAYVQASDAVIDTDGSTAEDVAERIIILFNALRKKGG